MNLHLDATAARLERANLLHRSDALPAVERRRRAEIRLAWFVVRRAHWVRRARHAWKAAGAIGPAGGPVTGNR
jgi:hypothetical protein